MLPLCLQLNELTLLLAIFFAFAALPACSRQAKPEIKIERGVYFGARKFMDVPSAVIFVVLTVATVILALTTIAGAPPSRFDEGGEDHLIK